MQKNIKKAIFVLKTSKLHVVFYFCSVQLVRLGGHLQLVAERGTKATCLTISSRNLTQTQPQKSVSSISENNLYIRVCLRLRLRLRFHLLEVRISICIVQNIEAHVHMNIVRSQLRRRKSRRWVSLKSRAKSKFPLFGPFGPCHKRLPCPDGRCRPALAIPDALSREITCVSWSDRLPDFQMGGSWLSKLQGQTATPPPKHTPWFVDWCSDPRNANFREFDSGRPEALTPGWSPKSVASPFKDPNWVPICPDGVLRPLGGLAWSSCVSVWSTLYQKSACVLLLQLLNQMLLNVIKHYQPES